MDSSWLVTLLKLGLPYQGRGVPPSMDTAMILYGFIQSLSRTCAVGCNSPEVFKNEAASHVWRTGMQRLNSASFKIKLMQLVNFKLPNTGSANALRWSRVSSVCRYFFVGLKVHSFGWWNSLFQNIVVLLGLGSWSPPCFGMEQPAMLYLLWSPREGLKIPKR